MVQGVGFRAWGFGFRVWGLGLRVSGLGLRALRFRAGGFRVFRPVFATTKIAPSG